MDFEQAITFIETKGTQLEIARLHSILHASIPPADVTRGFFELQCDDGGFPFGMRKGNLSTINETTVAMWWMEELNQLGSASAKKAFTYLLTTQQPDGSWEEDPRIAFYELPSWIRLDDPNTKLYLSAYATYWLAVGGYSNKPGFRKAAHYLLRNQEKSGRFQGYLHTTWIATGVFLMLGERYESIAHAGIQALSERPLAGWDDNQIAWALDSLSRGGLPKTHPFVDASLAELLRRQKDDGSWASEDGEDFALGATIQVLKVLKRYNLLTDQQAT